MSHEERAFLPRLGEKIGRARTDLQSKWRPAYVAGGFDASGAPRVAVSHLRVIREALRAGISHCCGARNQLGKNLVSCSDPAIHERVRTRGQAVRTDKHPRASPRAEPQNRALSRRTRACVQRENTHICLRSADSPA